MTFLPRHPRIQSISSLIVLAGVSIGAPAIAQDLTSTQGPTQRIEGGGPVDVKRLATGSSLIVRGRVVKGEPKWVGRVTYTFYELAVQETVKGLPRKTVSVAVPGGAIGNVELIVPQAPAFSTGDELVFFGQNFAGERSAFQPTGAFDGLIPIRASATSQAAVAPRGKPEDLEEFLREVRAVSAGR